MTPCTVLISRPYPGVLPPPLQGGRWGDFAVPNSVLSLSMGREQPGRQVDSALMAVDSMAESLPIVYYLYHYFPSVGLR